jgi:PAS domain S-box-containing protein
MFGCNAETALGAPLDKFIPAQFRQAHRQYVESFGRTGVTSRKMGATDAITGLRTDGEEFPIEASISHVQVGKEKLYTVILRDITLRKEALEALHESEERFRAFFNTAVVGAAQADADGRLIEVNDCYCRITGYSREELLRTNPLDLVHPEDREADREQLRLFYQGQAPAYDAEKRYVRKDGTVIWVHVAAGLIRDPAGQPVRTAAFIEDITQRKRTEEQLRLQAVALESAANAILITDRDGSIEWVNDAFTGLTGYSAAEALGQNPRLFKSGRHSPSFFKGMWETVLAGRVWHGEVVNKRKDGSLYTEEMTITPVMNGGSAGTHFIAIKQDVTARKNAERALREAKEELARSNARLEELVNERTAKLREMVAELEHYSYSLVHDMRAPLRALQSFAGLVEEESGHCLTPEAKDYLSRVRTAANRMDQLITDALSYSKAVRTELPVRPVDIAALLRGMLESYPGFETARADIRLEGEFPKVLGNEAGLTQCFSNLLHNAVKFVAPGQNPRVRIWAERREAVVRVWVEDNGVGIPPQGLRKIFEMFQRMHGTEYEGTGIGLALVRKVMERMGGRVGVESELGKGSRFWVELKAAA